MRAMKSKSVWRVATAVDGRQALAELASFELDGLTCTSGGALVSAELVVGYVKGETLTTWTGEPIMKIRRTGGARGFRGTRLVSYAGEFAGRRWHGRGLGECMILRMRPGRNV
jgi:hypothetical protein